MLKNEIDKERLESRLLEAVDYYRGLILDLAEQEIGCTDNWSFIRGRLLKALGDRGLSRQIREIIQAELREAP